MAVSPRRQTPVFLSPKNLQCNIGSLTLNARSFIELTIANIMIKGWDLNMASISELRDNFDGMTLAQKKQFINNLKTKLQGSNNAAHKQFLNECIQKYNDEARLGTKYNTDVQSVSQSTNKSNNTSLRSNYTEDSLKQPPAKTAKGKSSTKLIATILISLLVVGGSAVALVSTGILPPHGGNTGNQTLPIGDSAMHNPTLSDSPDSLVNDNTINHNELNPPPDFPENPVSDFEYAYDEETSGVEILRYIGTTASGNNIGTEVNVRIPEAIQGYPVTKIGAYAFSYMWITYVYIPNSVKVIDREAFLSSSRLTSVTIPGSVTTIGVGAFYRCTDLTSITIASGVTSIGVEAFFSSGLTSVRIPSSVTSIGHGAFASCGRLYEVYFESAIPPTIVRAAYGASRDVFERVASGAIAFVPEASPHGFGIEGSMWEGLIVTTR